MDDIAAGDPAFTTITATPRKLAHRVEVSNEAVHDSVPDVLDVVNSHLVKIPGLKLDAAVFEGSGSAPVIRGLKNLSGIQTVSMGTNLSPGDAEMRRREPATRAERPRVIGERGKGRRCCCTRFGAAEQTGGVRQNGASAIAARVVCLGDRA